MITEAKNLNDVAEFMRLLVEEGVNAHPDEDFFNYVNMQTGVDTYTSEEAAARNRLLAQCFEVCEAAGTDIYSFMQEIFLIATGMNTFIPLPSAIQQKDPLS